MIRLFTLLMFLATPALATQDGWPALYDVTGVASDDVLNVRSAPNAEADLVGRLAPDARNIEVIRPNEALTWGLINTGEGTGWASLAYLERQPGQFDGRIPDIRQCFGTEPFWALTIDPPRATFSTPDDAGRDGLVSGLFRSENRRDRFVFSGAFFPDDFGVLDMQMTLRNEACGDGMSDRAYGYSVDLFLSGSSDPRAHRLLSGCCSISP